MKGEDIFLVDSNSFMTPFRRYYAFDLVPAYWEALRPYILSGEIVILDMVKSEIDKGEDDLAEWLNSFDNITILPHVSEANVEGYSAIIQYIAECGLYKESALQIWAQGNVADPWLIASSLANDYILVTEEQPSGGLSKKNPNKYAKIPDVAKHFGVRTMDVYGMMRELEILIM